VKNDEHAIKNSGPFNPLFAIFGQGDLFLGEYCSGYRMNSYEKAIRETEDNFSIEEFEVFQMGV